MFESVRRNAVIRRAPLTAPWRWPLLIAVGAICLWAPSQVVGQFDRPVDVAPSPDAIGRGYELPAVQRPVPPASWWAAVDVAALLAATGLVGWASLVKRSRSAVAVVGIGCLVYFGLYRKGCVCPIGAIQNIAVALTDSSYALPLVVIIFFFLPLVVALFYGRVFCGGACPLGAIQDLVVLKPVTVPRRLECVLGKLKYVYLGLAICFAVRPAPTREFLICAYDPFVGLFRMTGPGYMLIAGGMLLVLGTFIGRAYCRYLCPYGALLAIISRASWRGVSITPDKELDCGLCSTSCPFGAIEHMRAVRSSCLHCARCYRSCPRDHRRIGLVATQTLSDAGEEDA